MIENLKVTLIDSVSNVSEKIKDSFSIFSDLKDAGSDKLSMLVNEILSLSPLIEQAGFAIVDFNIDITIPPGININFKKNNEISKEDIDALLEENKDKELLKLIIHTLIKSDSIQKSLNLKNYTLAGLSVKLGLPPDVSLKFTKNNNNE